MQTIGFSLLCLCGALCLVGSNKRTGRQLTSFLCVVRMVSNMRGSKSRRQISPEALNHIKGSSARSRRFCFNFHKRGMLDVGAVRLLALLDTRKNLARSTCDVSDISTELLPWFGKWRLEGLEDMYPTCSSPLLQLQAVYRGGSGLGTVKGILPRIAEENSFVHVNTLHQRSLCPRSLRRQKDCPVRRVDHSKLNFLSHTHTLFLLSHKWLRLFLVFFSVSFTHSPTHTYTHIHTDYFFVSAFLTTLSLPPSFSILHDSPFHCHSYPPVYISYLSLDCLSYPHQLAPQQLPNPRIGHNLTALSTHTHFFIFCGIPFNSLFYSPT